MQHKTHTKVLPVVLLAMVITGLLLVWAPIAQAAGDRYVATTGADSGDCSLSSSPCLTFQYAIDQAIPGDTIHVAAGTYVVSSVVNVNKTGITLDGAGAGATIVQVSGIGDRFNISASGVTFQDFELVKTDKTGEQNIIRVSDGNGVTIKNNTVHGQFVIGDPEVSRAMVINAGAFSGLNIEGNTIYALRQPAYVSGTHAGTVQNNYVYGTKGWVLEGGNLTFTGNTWGTGAQANVYDIAILGAMPGIYYTDIVAMSNANNEAVIEDQRASPRVLSVVYVDDSAAACASDCGGQVYPFQTIAPAIPRVVTGGTIKVLPGAYTENVNVNKALKLRGAAGGGFSTAVATGPTAAPGVWYPDRYRPAVFKSDNFGGEMVLHHGVRVADSAANRPPAYSSTFYNTQGRKYDTNLTGSVQSFTIDLWVDATWGGVDQRNAGVWSTGFDSVPAVSAYPIVAFRNVVPDPPGFYAFDYLLGGWLPLRVATPADYNKWHTLSFVLTAGTGVQYFVDGQPLLNFADPNTTKLGNLILNVYNFGTDYDVYWDNFKVGSATPATFESVVTGQITISSNDVEVTGLYLTNPGQAYGVLANGALSNIKIANNRIQDLGGTGTTAQIKGVYLPNGADNVTISNNVFDKIVASSTRSADAINFGDSTTTDQNTGVVIEANNISNITAGRGAYGVKLNNGAGVPGVQIKKNTFTGLNGLWSHAVGLETNTLNAVVTGNTFSNLTVTSGTDNAAVWFEANPSSNTATVTGNEFNGTAFHGVLINAADVGLGRTATAENNWWGTPCGPGPVGPGTGALVGTNVDFFPWWTDVYGGSSSSYSGSAWIVPSGSTTAQTNAIVACAGSGSTVQFATSASPYQGGIVVNNPGITINLNGQTVGPGSPAFTINADDFTLNGPGTLDGVANASPGILVNGGADNFILNNAQIKNWADGVEIAGSVTSFKMVNNWINSNTDAGLQVDSGVSFGGVVTIQGNLFKVNGGNGVQNDGATTNLNVEYNSWGDVGGPAVGVGDGVGGSVDYTPWTFAETYIDVDPTVVNDQYQRNVNESTSFNVELKLEAANLYGLAFQFSFDPTYLTFNGPPTFSAPWSGNCTVVGTPPSGTFKYQCFLTSGPAWNGGTVATFNFTANGIALTGNGPWTTYFDISHLETNTNAAAIGGVKVFVNNAGFNAPSTANRDITDTNDGRIDITGIAKFTGFVDVQGRPNDSGAKVDVYGTLATGGTLLASGTSVSSGSYTTNYIPSNLLTVFTTYYFQVDRALYLPTTVTNPSLAANWASAATLNFRPLTSLNNLLLLGGDATDDNKVDLLDATCIGNQYGIGVAACLVNPSTSSSDVNGDGVTNILDLVLFGGNYFLTSSPWTP